VGEETLYQVTLEENIIFLIPLSLLNSAIDFSSTYTFASLTILVRRIQHRRSLYARFGWRLASEDATNMHDVSDGAYIGCNDFEVVKSVAFL
jgi:hypothetical protein